MNEENILSLKKRLKGMEEAREANAQRLQILQQQEWAYQGAIATLRDTIREFEETGNGESEESEEE